MTKPLYERMQEYKDTIIKWILSCETQEQIELCKQVVHWNFEEVFKSSPVGVLDFEFARAYLYEAIDVANKNICLKVLSNNEHHLSGKG